ncbi:MAG: hypothetical protein HQL11_05895 [Candidatus Omnitrophica bacterium]|nr:hypothetical protein [Candidatus Omnitrophota bacterium]
MTIFIVLSMCVSYRCMVTFAMDSQGSMGSGAVPGSNLIIDKNAYPNTVSVIKDARAALSQGKVFDALLLYEYADKVSDLESEPILKRKIETEKADAQKQVEKEIARQKTERLKKLEARQLEKIQGLYKEAIGLYEDYELEEAAKIFDQILLMDLDQKEAQRYIEQLIPEALSNRPEYERKLAERRAWKAREAEREKEAWTQAAEAQSERDRSLAQRLAWEKFTRRKDGAGEAPGEPADPNEPRLMIHEIRLEGNSVFEDEYLKQVVAPSTGRELTFGELEAAAKAVEQYYHDGGYFLAQVLIPEQDIQTNGGVAEFKILEGQLGELIIENNDRYSDAFIRKNLYALRPGEPFRRQTLERAMVKLNHYPGLTTSSTFRPGKAVGSTDVIIDVTEARRIKGTLQSDNLGVDTTGKYHATAGLSFPNLTANGDELSGSWTQGVDLTDKYSGTVSYSLPLGTEGFRLSSHGTLSSFPVGKEFAILDIESDVSSWGFGASYPFIMDQTTTLSSEVWYESSNFEQTLLGGEFKNIEDRVRKLRVEVINFDQQDLTGRSLLTLGVHHGFGEAFGAMKDDSVLSSRSFAKADNDFTKMTAGFARVQGLAEDFLIVGRVSGQYTFDTLVAGEQWAIGGMDSVHGYDAASFLGDHGFTANLEGRWTMFEPNKSSYQLLGFFDVGKIFLDRPTIDQRDALHIAGTGVGIDANIEEVWNIRVDWGIPVGPHQDEEVSKFYFRVKYDY